MADDLDWLGVEAASRYLGVSAQTIYRLVRNGKVPARSGPVRIRRGDLDAYSERSRIRPGELAHQKQRRPRNPSAR